MKGKDLLMIGGLGLAVYLLMPKAKEAAAGGITTIIPMPTPGEAPLDIGGLFSGIASIFGAMPAQIVPEINIPEFKWPDITMPEINIPDIPEFIMPALPDELKIPDIPSLIPDIPSLIPKKEDVWQYVAPSFTETMGGMLGTRWAGVQSEVIDMFAFFLGLPRPYEKWLEIGAETEAIFEKAGVSEVTPETLPIFKQARGIITGEKAERIPTIGTPEYHAYMGLKPRPLRKIQPVYEWIK